MKNKRIKRGLVDSYLKNNPNVLASIASKEIGCDTSTIYAARKRLGIPTSLRKRKKASLQNNVKSPAAYSEAKKFSVVADDLGQHWNEITKLQKSFALAKNAIYGLHVVVAAIIAVLVFKG